LLVAADTFRAAAPEQLASWANIAGVDIHIGMAHQDPAAVVFSGCERFVKEQYQVLIVDTAGRLHNKVNLMHELAKIKRVMAKVLAHDSVTTLLVIDGMLGQSSFEQARIFKEATQVDGVILTKMDGTAKGGVVFALAHELALPVYALAFGEQMDAFKPFEPRQFVDELLTL
jgi:fused signal recognition particle receptor